MNDEVMTKIIAFLADDQLKIIERMQGADDDRSRLVGNYLSAKIETDKKRLEFVDKSFEKAGEK